MPTWKQAYLYQARSDFRMYKQLQGQNEALCHQLHFLQMACEKMGKAFITRPNEQPEMSHKTFAKLVQYLKNSPELRRYLGFEGKNEAYRSLLNSLLPLANKIENLVPQGMELPNTEYPWIDGGLVFSPLDYSFGSLFQETIRLNKLMTLLEQLLTFEVTD